MLDLPALLVKGSALADGNAHVDSNALLLIGRINMSAHDAHRQAKVFASARLLQWRLEPWLKKGPRKYCFAKRLRELHA